MDDIRLKVLQAVVAAQWQAIDQVYAEIDAHQARSLLKRDLDTFVGRIAGWPLP